MSQSNIAVFLGKLGLVSMPPKKRIPTARNRWGTETEQLENRALLSAANCPMDVTTTAEVRIANHRRLAPSFPSVAGNWNVVTTGPLSTNGTVAITQSSPKSISSTLSLTGLAPIQSSGNFKARSDHTISDTIKVDIPGQGTKSLKLTLTFAAGNNPSTFSGQVKLGKVVFANFVGTKQISTI